MSITMARRMFVAQRWREATYTDSSVQTTHLLSQQLVYDSIMLAEADALAEATRLQGLRGVKRDRFEVTIALTMDTATLDLGQVVTIEHPRFSLAAGKKFVILGVSLNAERETMTLQVWG